MQITLSWSSVIGLAGGIAALIALALTAALAFRLLLAAGHRLLHKKAAVRFTGGNLWLYLAVCVGFWLVYGGLFSAGAGSSMAFSLTGTLELHFFGSILNAGKIVLGSRWPVLVPVLVPDLLPELVPYLLPELPPVLSSCQYLPLCSLQG